MQQSLDFNTLIQFIRNLTNKKGILFIIWGWLSFISYLLIYISGSIQYSILLAQVSQIFSIALPVLGLIFTILYVIILNQSRTGNSIIIVLYIWGSTIAGMVFINLIQFNINHLINFQLQHPIFMVLIAIATVLTGVVLSYKYVIAGGIAFGIMAYLCSYFNMHEQLLIESIAWVTAFIIPGHMLFSKKNIDTRV
jgi:hypothetical protein